MKITGKKITISHQQKLEIYRRHKEGAKKI
ncbi:MAG: hypothetical protein ACI89U_003271 [Gammaproteobacteria bacterium]